MARSGSVPSSSRSRRASASYVDSAAAVRPAATWARIRDRVARSSNGSMPTASVATRTASAGSTTVSAAASSVPAPPAQRVRLPSYGLDPVGVRLVQQRGLGAQQVEGPAGRGRGEPVLAGREPVVGLVEQRDGLVEVDRPGPAADQPVGPARRAGQCVAEQPSGAADQRRDVGRRVRGRVLGPEHVDDPVHRHQPPSLGGQEGQQGASLAAAQLPAGQGALGRVDGERRGQPYADRSGSHLPSFRTPGQYRADAGAAARPVGAVRQDGQVARRQTGAEEVLASFSEPTRTWFEAAFAEPTPAQVGAWQAIAAGRNALVVAPTGSGKTLSAFLWSIDRLAASPPPEKKQRCRVLYVSPLKALAVDVERNLRAPLTGIRHTSDRLGVPAPDITVGLRSGDTSAADRRRLGTTPPDILITTPESLFLMLTSQARESLRGVETVIVDEVHAVAGTKRGAHLALSLERLDELLERPAQRIGLSATVRPIDEVARFLGGSRPVEVVAPASTKEWDLKVVVPVEDMTELALAAAVDEVSEGSAASGAERRGSIWPHVEERVVDLIEQHRSTIVFANSRRLAERLTARFNEIAAERAAELSEPQAAGATTRF